MRVLPAAKPPVSLDHPRGTGGQAGCTVEEHVDLDQADVARAAASWMSFVVADSQPPHRKTMPLNECRNKRLAGAQLPRHQPSVPSRGQLSGVDVVETVAIVQRVVSPIALSPSQASRRSGTSENAMSVPHDMITAASDSELSCDPSNCLRSVSLPPVSRHAEHGTCASS